MQNERLHISDKGKLAERQGRKVTDLRFTKTMMAGLPEIQRRILGGEKMEILMKEVEKMDQEWKELILSALKMGISKEEIREFLKTQTLKN